jgi:hypothetical protein
MSQALLIIDIQHDYFPDGAMWAGRRVRLDKWVFRRRDRRISDARESRPYNY